MKIRELCRVLNQLVTDGWGEHRVLFDTEAQTYDCHFVSVDRAAFEEIPGEEPYLGLYEDAPHRSSDNNLLELRERLKRYLDGHAKEAVRIIDDHLPKK